MPQIFSLAFVFSFLLGIAESAYSDAMPSEEFLQFLVEFEDADVEVFDMVLENGLRDVESEAGLENTEEIEKVEQAKLLDDEVKK